MKILIIAQGRSGSNNLSTALSKSLDIPVVWTKLLDSNNFEHSSFVKVTSSHRCILKIHEFQKSNKFQTHYDFLEYCNNEFDHVLFHARANTLDVGLSLENGYSIKDYEWVHTKYTPVVDRPELHRVKFAAESIANIIEYAYFLNKDVTFYEELFSGNKELINNTVKRWGIDLNLLNYDILYRYLDPKLKYTNRL